MIPTAEVQYRKTLDKMVGELDAYFVEHPPVESNGKLTVDLTPELYKILTYVEPRNNSHLKVDYSFNIFKGYVKHLETSEYKYKLFPANGYGERLAQIIMIAEKVN